MGGLIIGLRDPTCNRWMRLTDHSDVEFSEPGEWNDDWSLERFEVHSVGTGLVGLKNHRHVAGCASPVPGKDILPIHESVLSCTKLQMAVLPCTIPRLKSG